ncbi:MAG TPA: pitrilysin family protein [Lysobacter sp.]|nr:pitrilysin family protein [Lysobacter sp.]
MKNHPRRLALALTVALACVSAATPAAPPAAPPSGLAAGACVEGICEYTLKNGLRVLLFTDASKPTVTVNIAYGVGSAHENYGETGMAHLLEHLLFKGTPKHADIPAELKKRGIQANATTWMDRTNYFGSFPADAATLDWLLGLEADRMVNALLAKEHLDSEMTVVRNEMERNENAPAAVTMQRLRATAYLWHNYGNSTIGARSDVENVPIERLRAFYRTWYRPDNATLVIAGRIDPKSTLERVKHHFERIPRPRAALPAFYTAEPTQDGEREVTVRRVGDLRVVALGYHVPGAAHADSAALAVLMNVLGDTPAGRLHKALVETKHAAGVGAGTDRLRDRGLATLLLVAPPGGDVAKAEAELLRQVEQIAERPITADEVAQAKQRIATAYEKALNDVNAVAMGLTESIAAGDWRLFFLQRDRVAAVTAEDVNRVARTYLQASNRTLARFVPTDTPQRAEIPSTPPAAVVLKDYRGRVAVAAGEAFDPTPANIDARTQTFTLGRGLKVSLLPKDTRGDTVTVSATFRFGDLDSLKRSPAPAGSAAGAMLMRGSRTLSREQIAQKLVELKTTGGVGGGLQTASIQIEARRDTLADALALAVDLLRNPAFSPEEFEQLRMQAITGLEAARKEPGTAVQQAMGEHFDPWPADHPYAHESIDEQIARWKALKLEDVAAFHRNFYGTADGEIAIVGDFDPVAARHKIETLFAGWESPRPYVLIRTRHHEVAPETERLTTPDKPNAVIAARANLSLNQNDPDYPALVVAAHVLGSGAMASRLGTRLREKDGLSYSVGATLHADASPQGRDDAGFLSIQAIAAPENVDRAIAGLRDELDRFVRDGITTQELAAAISEIRKDLMQARASDGALARTLARNLYMGRTMAWSADLERRLESLTVEEVNAAIRVRFKPQALSVYAAGDFDKVAKSAQAASANAAESK